MFHRIGAAAYKNDLSNTIALCKSLGNPELKFKTIHVAGTNGKGSTSHALAAIFQQHGFKTGLYTSPHLVDFRERIRINGEMIPKDNVITFIEKNKNFIETINPSFFEATVGMAFEYFANEKVDIAIIETGLGGRLDSTNVITPILSVITNISLDHTDLLGDTLQKIAWEKAGIIKPNIPVVIGETHAETKEIFIEKAGEINSEIFFADTNPNYFNTKIVTDLLGDFQQKNLVTALQAVEVLKTKGFNLSNFEVARALQNIKGLTGLRGRWEILNTNPYIVCDTGHNQGGLEAAMHELKKITFKKLYMVFGVVSEKNTKLIWPLLPKNANYFFCKPSIPRGRDDEDLRREATHHGISGKSFGTVKNAFEEVLKIAEPEDAIFIGGSTFVVADYLMSFEK
ncbi:MAG: bifunctional folylpolyglutamate synthase/dihydrofolate synthase [Bacteroidia bacterium]